MSSFDLCSVSRMIYLVSVRRALTLESGVHPRNLAEAKPPSHETSRGGPGRDSSVSRSRYQAFADPLYHGLSLKGRLKSVKGWETYCGLYDGVYTRLPCYRAARRLSQSAPGTP